MTITINEADDKIIDIINASDVTQKEDTIKLLRDATNTINVLGKKEKRHQQLSDRVSVIVEGLAKTHIDPGKDLIEICNVLEEMCPDPKSKKIIEESLEPIKTKSRNSEQAKEAFVIAQASITELASNKDLETIFGKEKADTIYKTVEQMNTNLEGISDPNISSKILKSGINVVNNIVQDAAKSANKSKCTKILKIIAATLEVVSTLGSKASKENLLQLKWIFTKKLQTKNVSISLQFKQKNHLQKQFLLKEQTQKINIDKDKRIVISVK